MMSQTSKRALSTVVSAFAIMAVAAATHPSAEAQSDGQLCISAMTPEEFHAAYPKLLGWIQKTLGDYENIAQPVASMHFAPLEPREGGHLPMKTAAEYRAMAEECFRWAREASDKAVRTSYLQMAQVWLDAAPSLMACQRPD